MRSHPRRTVRWSVTAYLLLSIVACSQGGPGCAPAPAALSERELLRFERTVCFGECPAYKLDLFEDGRLQYTGRVAVAVPGPAEVRVAAPAMAKIRSSIQRLSGLNTDCCNCYDSTDSPSVKMTFTAPGGETKGVDHYHGCDAAPEWLYDVENSIDETLDSEQWTGKTIRYKPHRPRRQ